MDLVGMHVRDLQAKAKFTVLKRPHGKWSPLEVCQLVNGLRAECQQHPQYPEFVVLLGEFGKNSVDGLLTSKEAFEYSVVTGFDNPELPFRVMA